MLWRLLVLLKTPRGASRLFFLVIRFLTLIYVVFSCGFFFSLMFLKSDILADFKIFSRPLFFRCETEFFFCLFICFLGSLHMPVRLRQFEFQENLQKWWFQCVSVCDHVRSLFTCFEDVGSTPEWLAQSPEQLRWTNVWEGSDLYTLS